MLRPQRLFVVKIINTLIALGLLFIMAFAVTGCTTSSGIPTGIYNPIDENNNYKSASIENTWSIYRDNAEYLYTEFKIIEEEGKTFFETKVKEPSYDGAHKEPVVIRYEVKYDKKTKILTVYMACDGSAPYTFPLEEMKIFKLRFKKTGISIAGRINIK